MPNWMTRSEYARHRGINPSAVTRAIARGKIATFEVDGKTRIDCDVADIQWEANGRSRSFPQAPDRPKFIPELVENVFDLQVARAKREHHEANIAEMRERKLSRELVELARVEKANVDAAALLRSALERIAGKLAEPLAAEADPIACKRLVAVEINQALQEIATELGKMAERYVDDPAG